MTKPITTYIKNLAQKMKKKGAISDIGMRNPHSIYQVEFEVACLRKVGKSSQEATGQTVPVYSSDATLHTEITFSQDHLPIPTISGLPTLSGYICKKVCVNMVLLIIKL